jgi:hypothetical protein
MSIFDVVVLIAIAAGLVYLHMHHSKLRAIESKLGAFLEAQGKRTD